MPAVFSGYAGGPSATTSGTDVLLDGLSSQLSTLTNRRLSRGSNGPLAGNSMRIMKPRSANNSPRSSVLQGRRRTIINDCLSQPHRTPPAFDNAYMAMSRPQISPGGKSDLTQRSSRPLSWHPSSQLPQSQTQIPPPQQYSDQPSLMHYPLQTYTGCDLYTSFRNLPPTPAAYSGYTSPASAFSPLSLPYSEFEHQQPYFSPAAWAESAQQQVPAVQSLPNHTQVHQPNLNQPGQPGQSTVSSEWDLFAAQGFDRCTGPPTPQDFVQAPAPEPRLQSEDSIPYEPLEDDESNGEILYGLGLYDAPEKQATDSQADYHRSVVSSLLGSACTYSEPTGKGLKLEDAWEPPENEEEEESSQDGSDDAEGEDQEQDEE